MSKIIQLVPPAVPVFAVYKTPSAEGDLKEADIWIEECPVLALIENEDGDRIVVGLTNVGTIFDEPTGPQFLGYVHSWDDAKKLYVRG